jgi:DNA-cytosine methyltransferase
VDHTEELTHISLCAGYAGIDLGLRRVIPNIRTIAFSEIEAYAVANLVAKIEAGHLDAAPVWSDLKTFPFSSFRGKVDIISGGFPCQPFSSAGRRQGDEDPRHLWPYIVRGIKQSSPRMVFFENVEGIISSKLKSNEWNDPEGTSVLLHVLRELERLGYRATAGVFSAAEVGAPHQRKRVFILGSKLSNAQNDRLQRSIKKYKLCKTCDENEEQSKSTDYLLESTLYPSRRGEKKYRWEPPRVLTMGNADGGQQKSRIDKYRILSKATKEEKADINTRASSIDNRTKRKAQPALGRCVDGSADRLDYAELYESFDNITDELRLLGNGVVPDTAARAFEVLWNRLNEACIH